MYNMLTIIHNNIRFKNIFLVVQVCIFSIHYVYFNIFWSSLILHESAGEPIRTVGTSAGVMESSIKVLENQVELLEHLLELWNPYKSAGDPVRIAGTSAGVMESSIRVLEDRFGLLEHILE